LLVSRGWPHSNPSIRFKANQLIIKRTWGRPVTPVIGLQGFC
jgi:hypothetical protein